MRAPKQTNQAADDAATLLTHVRELQLRLLVTAAVLVGAGVAAYLYYGQILDLLRSPLDAPLYYNSVSGSFSFVMKICLVAGIAVSVPLIVYNLIMFVRPAFIEVFTLKRVALMTAGSIVAAAAGMVFGFVFIIPGALHFFSGFQVHGLKEMISADSYLNFVINVLITFVLMFQLPIIVSLIDRIKPISLRMLWKGEKWALVGSIVIAAVVPFAMDLTTQILIATPIFLLYNLSFAVISFQHRYTKGVVKKAEKRTANIAHKNAQALAKYARKPAKRPVSAPTPAAATQTLQPHPQLAEVLALQASPRTKTSPTVATPHHTAPMTHRKAAAVQPAHKPVTKPIHHPVVTPKPVAVQPVVKAVVAAPQALAKPISMDVMSPAPSRSQPANVIRQAGSVHAPQRPMAPNPRLRSLNMMADIR